ncbi:efflux transporter, RND family, MFP subunit [Candidatus Thiomargarita nelsonii]|uniref:Efflux transporter, RND family, MFP subunit n=1 Tax=Candidatus Thiomargarita nelsonii TaxID=1003181 RepID=A0A176S545_9GAMM|nr:efflux transporter, RND family, MFP subunit [Candidatus Thiomargarita nelsonii]
MRLDLTKKELTRAQRLFKSHAISEEAFDIRTKEKHEATAALRGAKALVESAKLNVQFTRVKAPITGRISRALVTEGNLVSGGTAGSTLLTTIVSLDPIHFYFTADERAVLRYLRLDKAGARPSSQDNPNPVRLQLADEQGFPHQGHMDFVDNRIDQAAQWMVLTLMSLANL